MRRKPRKEPARKGRKESRARQQRRPAAGRHRSVEPDGGWESMVSAYPDHPAWRAESIYAMPRALVDAIRRECRGFFTDGEIEFETRLSDAAGSGFFLKRSFHFDGLIDQEPLAPRPEDQQLARIDAMLIDEIRKKGGGDAEVAEYFATKGRQAAAIETRRWAYAGWLATDPVFRGDVSRFKEAWDRKITARGRLPVVPKSLLGEKLRIPSRTERPFVVDYTMLYRRWGLDSLATWDLPVPMFPVLGTASRYDLAALSGAGVIIFAPWYLLRDKQLSVHELGASQLIIESPQHLGNWLSKEPANFAYDRYGAMLKLFFFLELCLNRRYAARIKGKIESLDRALGQYIFSVPRDDDRAISIAETVKKIRQEMRRRLKQQVILD